ncbi:3'-5'-exoribonuclease [Dispira simplex]|nr:3'-5'-exoribonuclease [Dispira simplex]
MDRRRITGPELSVPPLMQQTSENESPSSLLDNQGKRQDGRPTDTIRPLYIKTGLISQANGSAYSEQANTRITCAVYGPRQNKKAQFNEVARVECDFKLATFACTNRRSFQKDAQEKELSHLVAQAITPAVRLNLYPKSTIDVYITVVQSDGWWSTLAGAITCASAALVDAGIDMVDLVTATSAVVADGRILADPTCSEENHPTVQGTVLVAGLSSLREVTHVVQSGSLALDITTQATNDCIETCSQLHEVVGLCLKSSLVVCE